MVINSRALHSSQKILKKEPILSFLLLLLNCLALCDKRLLTFCVPNTLRSRAMGVIYQALFLDHFFAMVVFLHITQLLLKLHISLQGTGIMFAFIKAIMG